MLAHKSTHEGKVAAEVASGHKSAFDARVIPSVAYTDPEVAWVGVTETEAKAKGIKYGKAVFPWAASGRSLALGRDEGLTKTLWDEETQPPDRLRASSARTPATSFPRRRSRSRWAPKPRTSASPSTRIRRCRETFAMSAEAFAGTLTDLYMPKKR